MTELKSTFLDVFSNYNLQSLFDSTTFLLRLAKTGKPLTQVTSYVSFDVDLFIEACVKEFGVRKIFSDFQRESDDGKPVKRILLENEETVIFINHSPDTENYFIEFCSIIENSADVIHKFLTENSEKIKIPERDPTVFMAQVSNGKVVFSQLPGQIKTQWEPGNYEDETLQKFYRGYADLCESDNPRGKIVILDGPPGCGKTHLVKRMITEGVKEGCAFIYLKPSDILRLSDADMLKALINLKANIDDDDHIIIIVEDADSCLAPRDGGNNDAVSAILNLGDGIVGEMLDIRLVLTTNAKRQDFDSAITRPGRLSELINVPVLSVEKSCSVFDRLVEDEERRKEFKGRCKNSGMTLASVYAIAKDPSIEIHGSDRKIGF